MDNLGLFASIVGHIGDGNFHESILYNKEDPVQRAKVEKSVYDMVNLALEMDGSCTVSFLIHFILLSFCPFTPLYHCGYFCYPFFIGNYPC